MTRTSRSTAFAAPTSATSWSSRRRSPTPPSIVLEQNYRSTQTHPRRRQRGHRQQPRPQAQGAVDRQGRRRGDRPLPRRRRGRRGAVGRPPDAPPARRPGTTGGATAPSSTAPTPRAASSRSSSCGSGIPYKVIGGTRFYDRREVKDALAYLKAVVNPVDEVSVKRILNVPKRGIGDSTVGQARRVGQRPRPRRSSRRCAAATTPGSAGGPCKGIEAFLALLDDLARAGRPTGPAGRCSRRSSTGRATSPSSRPSTRSRPRAASRTWPSWSASAREFETVDEFLEQVSLVADTDELDDDDSLGRAHDAALGQGPRVPGRVPHRAWRTASSPTCGRSASPTSSRRSAASPTSASPGPWSGCYLSPRLGRTLYGSTQYNPPSRFLDEIPEHLVEEIEGERRGRARPSGRRRSADSARGGDASGVGRHVARRAPRAPWSTRRCKPPRRRPRAAPTSSGLRVGRRRAPRQVRRGRDPRHRGRGRQGRGAWSTSPASARRCLLLTWAPLEKI